MSYARFAIYYLPTDVRLAEFGAAWLGWDVQKGAEVPFADDPVRAAVIRTPQKYGFHATLKPPFRLLPDRTPEELCAAVAHFAADTVPACSDGLRLARLGRFLALVSEGDDTGIAGLAASCVTQFDAFRAPATEAELARRRQANLSPRQNALLMRWGYPYVLEQFRFHMTLTGRIPKPELPLWEAILCDGLPKLPKPFVLDAIALVGERPDGRFEQIAQWTLRG